MMTPEALRMLRLLAQLGVAHLPIAVKPDGSPDFRELTDEQWAEFEAVFRRAVPDYDHNPQFPA